MSEVPFNNMDDSRAGRINRLHFVIGLFVLFAGYSVTLVALKFLLD